MKINEVTIKRITEAEETIIGTDGKGIGPTGYGSQDEGLGMALANAVATGLAAKMLKKILERKALPRLLAFIPGFGFAVGLYFAGKSIVAGDYVGAGVEAGIGLAGGSVVANVGAVGGIAFLVYREFYKELTGSFPISDAFSAETPLPDVVDNLRATNAMFGLVYESTEQWIYEVLGMTPEVNQYAANVAKQAGSCKSANPKKDALLNDIFQIAFKRNTHLTGN